MRLNHIVLLTPLFDHYPRRGDTRLLLCCAPQRVACPCWGVHVEEVPWAGHASRFYAEGKSADTLGGFFDRLDDQTLKGIQFVTTDMSASYIKPARERLPRAQAALGEPRELISGLRYASALGKRSRSSSACHPSCTKRSNTAPNIRASVVPPVSPLNARFPTAFC